MKHKKHAIISFICANLLLGCIFGLLLASVVMGKNVDNDIHNTKDCLNGSELRAAMNEAKYSPGYADAYAEAHPDFAWLFDKSYVDYISN